MTVTAKTYGDRAADDKIFTLPFEIDRFEFRVSKTTHILDVGCGYGRVLGRLASAGLNSLTGVAVSSIRRLRGV
ncbi:MAG: hypothetical protein DSY90_12630 [Deltaproteobacteria bacterium]|nr:MAG: hypothetical protein DSY90_12630 [Deltaproteobacteria bacterium]